MQSAQKLPCSQKVYLMRMEIALSTGVRTGYIKERDQKVIAATVKEITEYEEKE